MAKDKGQVRRVLQILSAEDQETLAILHDPPRMEELLRRHETLAEVRAAGIAGGVGDLLVKNCLAQAPLPGLGVFPTARDELAGLPARVQESLFRVHLPALLAAPREGLALTQLFEGLWVAVYAIEGTEYRLVYEIDAQTAGVIMLMVGVWESLEQRLEGD
jgi:hypothetical protein